MEPIVFEHIQKSYNQKVALHKFSLSICHNKTTGVIGRSGSGKSTLIQLINGLIQPDQGKVYVFGKEIDYDHLPALRKRIGYAVQGTDLFPHLTVEKNITLLAKLEKWHTDRIQQRVGLCRTMILDPDIFLLDEPFGALDPITRSELQQEFLKLQKLAIRTVVLVTHDLREALKLADHLVILRAGQIE